jgi:protein-S-isoprenylcysteine O-methyltransferase Ste14
MDNFTGKFIVDCFLILAGFWVITAFSVKKTIRTKYKRNWIFPLLIIAAGAIFVIFPSLRAHSLDFGPLLYPQTLWLKIISDMLALSGLILAIWSRSILGRNWSSRVVIKENHELIKKGPYKYIRHPIYSGIFLMVLGLAFFWARISIFIFLILVLLGLWLKSLAEEKLLGKHFPEYAEYKKTTKAFIPFIF